MPHMTTTPRNTWAIAAALAALMGAAPAEASVITRTFQFTATNFTVFFGSGSPPVTTVTGSYTVTWDPSVQLLNQTTNITQNALNLTIGSGPAWNFLTSGVTNLQIGGSQNGAGGGNVFSSDFTITIQAAATATPVFAGLNYTQSTGAGWQSGAGTVSLVAAPEPGSLLLIASALTGLGVLRRRRAD